MSYHEAILPCFTHSCLIVQAEDRYLYCYTKVIPASEKKIVMFRYGPPKDGGQFNMTDTCTAIFPPIAEMMYLKTFSISVLVSRNKHSFTSNEPAVATGPLKYELVSLEQARKVFKEPPPEKDMYRFLSCFNSFNHYFMVAYPVGMHCGHFCHGRESL